jgi:hypothetical protein
MKNSSAKSYGALVCAALVATCLPAIARDAGGDRQSIGTVNRIDRLTRVLRIQRYGATLPLTLTWNGRTTFMDGTQPASAGRLSTGALISFWYHTPLIGKPVASKIVIEHTAAAPSQQGRRRR